MQIEALKRTWEWPEEDTKCRKVVFDWSSDLDIVYQHCKQFRTVIQAGGNMGVWPWLLSQKFTDVLTWEADPAIYSYLQANTDGIRNITRSYGALWSTKTQCTIRNDNPNNLGAQYIGIEAQGRMTTPTERLDDIHWITDLDLIYLDIEGAEMEALKGARGLIDRHRPCIVVEDKGLSKRYGTEQYDIEKWLAKDFGYKVVARPHRDVVLTCKSV